MVYGTATMNQKLRIAQVAPVIERVPPPKYGGTELVVSNITEELIRRGHDVHLFASGDSLTKAELHALYPKSLRAVDWESNYVELRDAGMHIQMGSILKSLMEGRFDVIHNHIGWRLLPFVDLLPCPVVSTLHGILTNPFTQANLYAFSHVPYVTISDAQRAPMPRLNYAATVYNGIDLAAFEFEANPDDYVAFLGRITPLKGIKEAIMAVKQANVRLVIGAKVDPIDEAYYQNEIKPLIDGKQIQFIGEVDHVGKVELLKNARALMALIQWEEPFGLFMVEALACGTPVIAIPRGSVPEIIEDGVHGYIVHSVDEAAEAIGKINAIDRQVCRRRVEEKFTISHMVDGYEAVYRNLIKQFKS